MILHELIESVLIGTYSYWTLLITRIFYALIKQISIIIQSRALKWQFSWSLSIEQHQIMLVLIDGHPCNEQDMKWLNEPGLHQAREIMFINRRLSNVLEPKKRSCQWFMFAFLFRCLSSFICRMFYDIRKKFEINRHDTKSLKEINDFSSIFFHSFFFADRLQWSHLSHTRPSLSQY